MTFVITNTELAEAIADTSLILTAIQGTISGQSGASGAQTNFLCGQLATNGSAYLYAGGLQFWSALRACFVAAQTAGATFVGMNNVLTVANGLAPVGLPGIAVKNFSIRMALATQAQILANTTFTSRQEIDNYFNQIEPAFDAAELVAADNLDNVAYQALINIHAAVSNDLATRAYTLPEMVTYSYPTRKPSLWIAQRLYQDASRNDELIAENSAINPLFMPSTGVALAS